jgi:cytochrome P450
LLAQHPKVAADLHEEIDSVLHGAAPTMEQLKQMPLLDNVLKESLRLFPAIPIVTRASHEPTELGGYRLPARTELFLSIYHTHRQPDVYREPLRFMPERWNSIEPGPYQYLPWGVGARTCLGTALATIQMKMLFAMLIPRYRLELVPGTKIDCGGIGIMKPKPELPFIVRAQDRRFSASKAEVRGTIHEKVEFA